MKTTHTPGPWRFNGPTVIAKGDWCLTVAICPAKDDPLNASAGHAANNRAEAEANCRLIAAAPDLLEYLTLALPSIEESEQFDKPHGPKLSAKVRALIESL